MPSFADIAQVARGEEAVLDWREVMALPPEAHRKAIGVAARHVWLWMSAQARQDDKEFTPTRMITGTGGKPEFAPGAETAGREGWRWDGIGADVYVVLWPSLNGKINGGHRDIKDPEVSLAVSFRNKVSRYLRAAGNVVNVVPGGARGPHGEFQTPQWFVAAEYDTSPPSLSYETKGLMRRAGYDGEDGIDQRARKLTAAQAGENRQAAPVVVKYTCRRGCAQTFAAEPLRDAHERAAHQRPATQAPKPLPPGMMFKPPAVKEPAPAPAPAPAPLVALSKPKPGTSGAPSACRVCGKVLSNRGNRNTHEKNIHPAEAEALFSYLCLYLGCGDRFDDVRGLGLHLGSAGHGLKEGAAHALRDRAVVLAEQASGVVAYEPEAPVDASVVVPATAHAATPEAARGAPEAPPVPVPAARARASTSANGGDTDPTEAEVEAYVRRLMTADARAQLAEAEARRLQKELEEREQKLASLRSLLGDGDE